VAEIRIDGPQLAGAALDRVRSGLVVEMNGRRVRIRVAPHCTQVWVISSRSFDAVPWNSAGATAVISIPCPQYTGKGV
jgi:hypothetical protein